MTEREPHTWNEWLTLKAGLLATHLGSYIGGFVTAMLLPVNWPALAGAVSLQTLGMLLGLLGFLMGLFGLCWFSAHSLLMAERRARAVDRAHAEAEQQKVRDHVAALEWRDGVFWDRRGAPVCPNCKQGLMRQAGTHWCATCRTYPLGDGPGPASAVGGSRVF